MSITHDQVTLERVDCESCGSSQSETLFAVADSYGTSTLEFPVVKCSGCGLVYVNPRPTEDVIGRFYPDEYFEKEVFHSAHPNRLIGSVDKRRLRDIARFSSVGRMLDVGCGNGRFLSFAGMEGWCTLGIEVAPQAAGYARDHYGLEVLESGLLEAGLPSGQFDVVTMWGVIEHLHHPKAAIREVARLLKPEGLLVTLAPNIASTQFRAFGSRWHLLDVPRHLYHFSTATLSAMAGDEGLSLAWGRYYAQEHDLGNLISSLETILHANDQAGTRQTGNLEPPSRKWTPRRLAMGVLRRTSPILARVMAGRRHSAAMELYFLKR